MTGEKILVIDDEPQILFLVGRFLERLGYNVQTAESGEIALQRLKSMPFALVLSDLRMPGVDGTQVLKEINAYYPDTIFILMTAFGTIDSALSIMRQGAYDYLTKPLELEDLRTTVQRALEHRTVVRQNRRLMKFLQEKNIDLQRLHQEEQHKSEQLNKVNAIARQITAILDVKMLTETVIRLVKPAFDFESFRFGIVEMDTLSFEAEPGEPVAQSLCWELTAGGQEPFVRSQAESPAHLPHDLVFPLRVGKRLNGFWVADWKEDAEYREENLPYLEALAAQTATALENARLYALARRADELAFLNRVGSAANQSLDLEETIQSVLDCVRDTFSASLVEICLWDEEQTVQHVFSQVQGTLRQGRTPCLDEQFVRLMRQESAIVCGQAEAEQIYPPGDQEVALRSLVGIILYFGQLEIGSLIVGSTEPDVYDVEDAHLLQIVGAQISTAIENARLFAEVVSGRQTILQSRNTLQTLFDGILEGIYIIDRDNTILAINRTQAQWSDRHFSELVGQPARLAFPASARSLELIAETFRTGEPALCTDRHRRADGGWTEWEIKTYPVAGSGDAQGPDPATSPAERTVDRVVVVVRDISEQRWLETSLTRSEKLASIGRLAAGIAHEINNPMTVISANAQILREEIPAAHPYYGSVELIDRASERASRIVRNLLDFSRAEQFEFVQMDLNNSLHDAISLVEPHMRRSNIDLSMELSADLPAIWASPDHLHVVWLNLLLNARDAIAEAQRDGWIQILSHCLGDEVVIQISDNGIGIPPDEINRIYDPFFTTKPPGKGTGLGLFTCYRTVHRHGGEIIVDSQVGVGTTFEVVLPIGQAPPTED